MVLWQLTTMAKKYIPVPRKPLAHTDDAASRLLGISRATFYRLLSDGTLQPSNARLWNQTSLVDPVRHRGGKRSSPHRNSCMNRLVITNQRGGVAKTTTTINIAWNLAERGKRVLIIDTDPQASVTEVLGLKPDQFLFNFLIDQRALDSCVTRTRHERVEVLCSNRDTNKAEDLVSTQTAREHAFMHTLRGPDREYDWILIDCAPSIGLFQACAMVYARKVLVPVAMETLSVQGAISAVNAADTLSRSWCSSHPSKSWA